MAHSKNVAGPQRLAHRLTVTEGFRLADVDPASTPGFTGDKKDGAKALGTGVDELAGLQERLFAQARGGGDQRRVLLLLQGMDTSGKGGILRHVVGAVDPQGIRHAAFKAPTEEERAHDFLWRIRRQLPQAGEIGVFDRSHYEDVLIVRVHGLVPQQEWERRYDLINAFERENVAAGTAMVKVMLHISRDEQKERLGQRLSHPDKYWKYNPADVDERARWDAYADAYQAALTRCSTREAPWHVVPADRKWYARWAVQQLLVDAIGDLHPTWPPATFDVKVERARVAAS
jgi:PPK2 family polyphosphate:nucleotide phosphotransferase